MIIRMPQEIRNEVYFLSANDKFFRPRLNPIGEQVNVSLVNDKFNTFTDLPLCGKRGYFILAAPST